MIAGPNTAADHITVTRAALTQLPFSAGSRASKIRSAIRYRSPNDNRIHHVAGVVVSQAGRIQKSSSSSDSSAHVR